MASTMVMTRSSSYYEIIEALSSGSLSAILSHKHAETVINMLNNVTNVVEEIERRQNRAVELTESIFSGVAIEEPQPPTENEAQDPNFPMRFNSVKAKLVECQEEERDISDRIVSLDDRRQDAIAALRQKTKRHDEVLNGMIKTGLKSFEGVGLTAGELAEVAKAMRQVVREPSSKPVQKQLSQLFATLIKKYDPNGDESSARGKLEKTLKEFLADKKPEDNLTKIRSIVTDKDSVVESQKVALTSLTGEVQKLLADMNALSDKIQGLAKEVSKFPAVVKHVPGTLEDHLKVITMPTTARVSRGG
jgi:cell fate (sporulation/competence/biofilm development) regulator YmcA (YheA/YmcA/DUF963 family)